MNYTPEEQNELIEKYEPLIGSVIKRKNLYWLDEYDELMQVGRIGLWKALSDYDPEKNNKIETFLWMSIYRRFIDTYLRKHKTIERDGETHSFQKYSGKEDSEEGSGNFFVDLQTPAIDSLNHIIFERVVHDIQNHPMKDTAQMVLDYYIDELGYQEIADRFGITRGGVNMRIKAFIQSYRKQLIREHYFMPEDLNMA